MPEVRRDGPNRASPSAPASDEDEVVRHELGCGDALLLTLDGISRRLRVARRGAELTVILAGRNHSVLQEDPLAPPPTEAAGGDRVTAPIPGRVAHVMVLPGQRVAKNAPLMVIEAMKMELTLRAPMEGIVEQVRHAVGDMVEEGTELVTFAAEAQQA